ncbi:MAG: CHC2 zinc finger domain-containing protein, partial [Candidatus Limnocylindrales bacterium]
MRQPAWLRSDAAWPGGPARAVDRPPSRPAGYTSDATVGPRTFWGGLTSQYPPGVYKSAIRVYIQCRRGLSRLDRPSVMSGRFSGSRSPRSSRWAPAPGGSVAVGVAAEVKSRLQIADVVGETVQLKKAGTTFKGLCPFHGEKTPSFVVTPARESWKCFG